LHVDSLASLVAEFRGALLLAFRVAQLLGREEAGAPDEPELELLRALTPIAKLTTARQAVSISSEVLESFGGAGYVEDTGLPRLLRDAQVLPIWEGTTNVLSLDVVRVLAKGGAFDGLEREVHRLTAHAAGGECTRAAEAARRATEHARAWLQRALARGQPTVEAGARHFALTLGRSFELALLVEHAAWSSPRGDRAPAAAARRLASHGVDLISDEDPEQQQLDARLLCDEPG
jgi:hypothetical protein